MRLKTIMSVLCLTIPLGLTAGEVVKLREIDAKNIKVEFEKGRVTKPHVIASDEDLAKAIPDSEAIKKQVDFTKEKLLLFAWGGSGGDKLTAKLNLTGKVAVFTYKGGLTRDFRRHVHLFVLPRNADFKVVGAGNAK